MSENPIKIVILQRGWVLVGRYSETDHASGARGHLTDASVVRYWGPTKGLGQLAAEGPTEATKLDPCPPATFHELTVVFMLNCNESKWASRLR
jgi:hypothetical protein